jgi:cellulose synthase/poly-beta-1,6-N-acetylglucosamine synthase-like glycosyltransferase
MPRNLLVSIIIPCKDVEDYTRECIDYYRRLDYPNFELVLLLDYSTEAIDGVIILGTGPVPSALQMKVSFSSQEILRMFLDLLGIACSYVCYDGMSELKLHLRCPSDN